MTSPSRPRTHVLKTLRTGTVVLLGTVPALSCSDGVTGPSDLTGGVWKLQSMELAGASRFVPDNPDSFTAEFHADGRIAVVADCNQCGGTYSLNDETLTVTGMSCTLALCATPFGGEFAGVIEGTASVEKDGDDQLEIESSEGKLKLVR